MTQRRSAERHDTGPRCDELGRMPDTVFLSPVLPVALVPVREAFTAKASELGAESIRKVEEVRSRVEPRLRESGWSVGQGARSRGGIALTRDHGEPVRADAVNRDAAAALWIETGRSWTNNGYLEHLIEAASCSQVEHLALAVRAMYDGSAAYGKIVDYLDPVLRSGRVGLPFKSILLVGF